MLGSRTYTNAYQHHPRDVAQLNPATTTADDEKGVSELPQWQRREPPPQEDADGMHDVLPHDHDTLAFELDHGHWYKVLLPLRPTMVD